MPGRRSPRLPSQIHASEEGAGMAPRLQPQTRASEEGAAVTRRSSPRLNPQIQANEDAAGIRRRRGTSPAAAASLPDNDDMLRDILLRLPPKPSFLPRASAVCKRWRGLVTDPRFHRQFYAHHRNPPLLGAFVCGRKDTLFYPMLDPPDRIPPQRFNLERYSGRHGRVLDCRHGLVLARDTQVLNDVQVQEFVQAQKEIAVCAPVTGEIRLVATPSEFWRGFLDGAVLCAADHAHAGCHSTPFKVVLVSIHDQRPLACVYSSETGLWGNRVSTDAPCHISYKPVVLVGSCLHWLSCSDDILVFDLDENSLTVIRGPIVTDSFNYENSQILQAEDGAVGFAILSYPQSICGR